MPIYLDDVGIRPALHAYIEDEGLPQLLDVLSDVCYEKFQQAETRQDTRDQKLNRTARAWLQMSRRMATASDAARAKGLLQPNHERG